MQNIREEILIISLLGLVLIIFNWLVCSFFIEFTTKIIFFIFGNILIVLFFMAHLAIFLSRTCDVCREIAKLFLANYRSVGQARGHYRRKYCLTHEESFLELWKEKLNQSSGKFIFLKEEKYFGEYFYLSFEDLQVLRPGYYTAEDIQLLSQILNSMEAICQICQNPSRVLLMHAGVIDYSVRPPLIKNKSFLQFNEALCVDCFLQFISKEIHRRGKNFVELQIDLPRNQMGIYLFVE